MMAKFLLGLATGIVFCVMAFFILVFALMRFGQQKPTVASNSTLVLNLEGNIPEKAPPELPLPFLEAQVPVTVSDLWLTLRKAAADPKIRAIVLEPRGLSIGWGKLEEIKTELIQFRKSGKPLVAFLRAPGLREYYLATAADRIYMSPEDTLDLKGLRIEAMFVKNTLDKIGAKMDVIHAGKYKDAGDMFIRDSMSSETREVLNEVLDQYYGDLVDTIAKGRKKTDAQIKELIDNGPLTARRALEGGLVDQLAYSDTATSDLAKRLDQDQLTKIALKTYAKIPASSVAGVEGRVRIALIVGQGVITRGSGSSGLEQEDVLASGSFNKLLREVAADSSIKGAILRIDSPGGDGVASDDILNEAKILSRKKPVVISMSDLAASGGYFISMTGGPIVAYPNTLTGSIGVIYSRLSLHGLYDKLGIQKEMLQRGRYAGINSDYAALTDDERKKVQQQIDEFYQVFLERVAAGRKRSVDEIAPLAQGRVWLGAQAKQNGLVNDLGGLDRAIELVKQQSGVAVKEQITLVSYPPKKSWFDILMSRSDDNPSLETEARRLLFGAHRSGLPLEVPATVRAWLQGGILEVMPYAIQIR